MKNQNVRYLVQAAVIAAIYVVLTLVAQSFSLASGAIQCRFSEALTILPLLTPAAIPGVTLGCLLANIVTGCALPDVIFGTLATFLGCLGTGYFGLVRSKGMYDKSLLSRLEAPHLSQNVADFLGSLCPVISNMIIIPLVLRYAYQIPGSIPYFMLTVGIGEFIAAVILGLILLHALLPFRKMFNTESN